MNRAGIALSIVLGAGCTDAGLQPYQKPAGSSYDDKLTVTAHLCTSPAVDDFFPVKILFVVDTSDSMSVTDRGGVRAQAIVDVLNRYAGNPSVKFGVIAFDSKIDVLTDGFTNSPNVSKISTRLTQADRLTDYQGALGAAYQMISTDILGSPRAERPRTKYVVVFFSDGTPDPQCSAKGNNPYLVCSVPREKWADAFDPPLPKDIYPDLQAGGDYNQPAQIFQKVDQIVALRDFYHVGEVRLHAAFLFDPKASMDPLAIPFHLDRKAGVDLLTQVATHGGGTFTEFDSSTKISFLNFGYAALKAPYALADFRAANQQALAAWPDVPIDSDGDGLSDAIEYSLRTCVGNATSDVACPDPRDTDGDGFSDFVEAKNLRAGFDPTDPKRPGQKCAAPGDADGDGLRDCEEAVYGTDPRLFDTDGDRMSDLSEVRAGLDPLDANDAFADPDRDGAFSIDELRFHTDPLASDQARRPSDGRYAYDVVERASAFGDRSCYDLTVRNIRLVTSDAAGVKGKNRILLYFDEALRDRPQDYGLLRVACVDARYVDGLVKSPPSGSVKLEEKNFMPAARFKPDVDCLDYTSWDPSLAGDAGIDDGGSSDGSAAVRDLR